MLPISLQLTFLRRTDVGPALLTVEDIKIGTRTSTIHVSLSQSRRKSNSPPEVKVAGYITVSPEKLDQAGAAIATGGQDKLIPKPAPGSLSDGAVDLDSLRINGRDGVWEVYPASPLIAVYHHFDVFTPPFPLQYGKRVNSIVEQWNLFRPGGNADTGPGPIARWTNDTVPFLTDIFPQALLRLGTAADLVDVDNKVKLDDEVEDSFRHWYPTVTLNIDIKKSLPVEGVDWLYSRVVTKSVRGGRHDLEVEIRLPNGELVATSTQVGLVMDIGRNLSNRL